MLKDLLFGLCTCSNHWYPHQHIYFLLLFSLLVLPSGFSAAQSPWFSSICKRRRTIFFPTTTLVHKLNKFINLKFYTWLENCNHLSITLLDMSTTATTVHMHLFLFLSFCVIPPIHLNIPISSLMYFSIMFQVKYSPIFENYPTIKVCSNS